MSDSSRSFLPWEEGFSKGLYLAGVECADYAQPPKGWTKWVIPGYEYLYVERDSENTFPEMLAYLEANAISLAGAVHDFTCPETGSSICSSQSAGFKGFEFLGDANAGGLNGQHRDDLHCEIWLSVEERERYLPVGYLSAGHTCHFP